MRSADRLEQQRRALDRPVDELVGGQHLGLGELGARVVARVHVRDRLAGDDRRRPAWRARRSRPRGRSDPPCARGPAPSRIAARPMASAPQRTIEPLRGAGTATTTGAASSTSHGSLGEPRIAALGLQQPLQRAQRGAGGDGLLGQAAPGLERRRRGRRAPPCARPSRAPARGSRPGRSPASISQASATSSALPTAAPSGESIAVSSHTVGRPARDADVAHAHGELARRGDVGHERALPHLDVEEDRVGARGELLRHHRGGDQAGRGHGARDVAQRVEQAVGRHEVGRLRCERAADARDLGDELLDAQRRRGSPGSTRACRACRPCARARGPRAWRPACPWRRRAERARSSSCRPRRPSSACRRPCARATRGRSSRPSRSWPASARASRSPRGRGRRPPSHQALICSGATRPATKPSTSHVISPGACSAPSRLRSISSTALTAIGAPGRPSPARAPSQAAAVAPTSANSPSWRPPGPGPGTCASSSAYSRE